MHRRKLARIVVPLCMLLVVGGIWLFRGGSSAAADSSDFALHSDHINLAALTEHRLPIIIDFGATACIPCIEMAPVLELLNEEFQQKAIIKFVDVWQYPDAAQNFPIMLIPTQIFIGADGAPYVPSEDLSINLLPYVDMETEAHIFTAHQGQLSEAQLRTILADMGAES